jgi:molybdopterin biosynthesis enzyme
MPERKSFSDALARIMELSYPPTTLKLPPARAIGHRLAKPVLAKGNQPVRPIALVDGLAVDFDDVLAAQHGLAPGARPRETGGGADNGRELRQAWASTLLTRHVPWLEGPAYAEGEPVGEFEPALSSVPHSPAEEGVVTLELRPPPGSARREDMLQPGQAIPVPVGSEVPRGASLIYPLEWLVGEPELDLTPRRMEVLRNRGAENAGEETEGDDDLPVQEPPRDWDLPARHTTGQVQLPLLPLHTPRHMTAIGDWARNREALLPERTIIRPGELALLEALEVDEVEVYRRPVVGIASLAPPFPSAQRPEEAPAGRAQGQCPLVTLCVELARAARIAALPLGYAPRRFRGLVTAIERWVEQVDILLIVGGTHHGPRSLALDALLGAGKATLAGVDLEPGGSLSAGVVNERPVLLVPGTLHDVLAGFVLFARPLAHKYLLPTNYSGTVEVVLDCASRIRVEHPLALPIRYGWDAERGAYCSRFTGRVHDPWVDFIRGQALVVFEPDAPYADGDIFTGYAY